MSEAVSEGVPVADTPARTVSIEIITEQSTARRRLLLFGLLAVTTVLLDQSSKYWIRATIPMHHDVPLVPGWVHLTYTLNKGAAWSMLHGQRWLLVAISVVVIGVVIWLARDFARRGTLPVVGLGLVLGGAIGNLIDRVVGGAVTDFIDLDTPLRWLQTFPVFNIADSALTVGVSLLLVYTFFGGSGDEAAATAEPPAATS